MADLSTPHDKEPDGGPCLIGGSTGRVHRVQ